MVMCYDKVKDKERHQVARVSVVNYFGHILLDEFIRPKMRVVNYLKWVSGIDHN